MTNKEKIIERLEKEYPNTLTSLEISKKTGINIDMVYVYLNDLNDKGKVVRVNNKKPYQYKTNTHKDNELVDKLVLLMVKAGINSEKYEINITESEIEPNIKRLIKGGLLG